MARGLTDILAYGLEPYNALEAQRRIVQRFSNCLGK
jgi:hypothetical protein